jgi:hypothetical protein
MADDVHITDWELYQVLTNRSLYSKTQFYDDLGNVVQLPFIGE